MGFSTVAAAAIIGVAIVMAMEIIVGTTIPTITEIHNSYDEMRERAIKQIQTKINITNAVAVANGSDHHDLTFTVENTGSVSLKTSSFDVLINGTKKSFTCSKTYLYPEDQAVFTLEYLDGRNGSNRLKIVTENGIEEYYTYTIP